MHHLIRVVAVMLTVVCSQVVAAGDLGEEGATLPHVVFAVDAATQPRSPFVKTRATYRFTEDDLRVGQVAAEAPERIVWFGEVVRLLLEGVADDAEYEVEMAFLSDSPDRAVGVVVNGETLIERLEIPQAQVLRQVVALPAGVVREGRIEIRIERLSGPNAVLSSLRLLSDKPGQAIPVGPKPIVIETPRLTPMPSAAEDDEEPVISLNGRWRFNPAPAADFYKYDVSQAQDWTWIDVPGQWSMQGFDIPGEQTVGYFHGFEAPPEWAGQRIKLRFDAVYGLAVVYINGTRVAESERTFTPFEVDITDAVRTGRNTIALAITNDCLANIISYGEGYARHKLGGIIRDVRMFAVPTTHIASLRLETDLDEQYDDALLKLALQLEGADAAAGAGLQVAIELVPRGTAAEPLTWKRRLSGATPAETQAIQLTIDSPAKWHPEHPNLYDLTVSLLDGDTVLHRTQQRIGFRKVEVRGTQLLVNGVRTKLRGVNRHEAHPLLGRALREPLWSKDANLFKDANVNFIRTSHYPPAEQFIEACDEIGLFVEVEAPIIWIGHGANPKWKDWDYTDEGLTAYFAQFVLETIERDYNHPSVIMWSLANESYWSENWERVAHLAEQADRTRPFAFHDQSYGGYNNLGSNLDIANIHYPGPKGAEAIKDMRDRPMLFGEYCHLNAYNRQELLYDPGVRDYWGEFLAPMWESMYRSDVCIGGAIWSGISDRFYLHGKPVGYDSWGPIDGWRRRKPEYWHVFKSYSPVQLATTEIEPTRAGENIVLRVENRLDVTDLAELDCRWRHGGGTGIVEARAAAQQWGEVRLQLDQSLEPGESFLLEFHTRRSHRLVNRFRITANGDAATPPPPPAQPVELRESPTEYLVELAEGTCHIAKANGTAVFLNGDDVEVMRFEPLLHIDPLEKQYTLWVEDFTPGPAESSGVYRDWRLDDLRVGAEANAVTAELTGRFNQAVGTFRLLIEGNGSCRISYELEHQGEPIDAREVGLLLALPLDRQSLSWRRRGQWSVYPTDHIGRLEGQASAIRQSIPWHVRRPAPEVGDITHLQTWSVGGQAWRHDATVTGTNDFRSSKRHIFWAALRDKDGRGVEVDSDGSQAVRAWRSTESTKLLIADYLNGGSENFLGSYHSSGRFAVEPGTVLRGSISLRLRTAAATAGRR